MQKNQFYIVPWRDIPLHHYGGRYCNHWENAKSIRAAMVFNFQTASCMRLGVNPPFCALWLILSRPLWRILRNPTLYMLTPGSDFVCTLQNPLWVYSHTLYFSTSAVPWHTCCGWMLLRMGGWEKNEMEGAVLYWSIAIPHLFWLVDPSQQWNPGFSTIFHRKFRFNHGVFALHTPHIC